VFKKLLINIKTENNKDLFISSNFKLLSPILLSVFSLL